MDKIKDIGFLIFKKHLFWTLSTIVVVMGVVAWWMAAGSLAGQYDANKTKVKGAHDKIDVVSRKETHEIYNPKSHEGLQTENTRRAKDVYLAWREKYIRQRRDVLVWPNGLSPKFIQAVDEKILKGRPIEEVTLDTKNDLITTHREEFRDQINVLLPQLAELIHSKWEPAEVSSRGGPGGRGIRPGASTPRPRESAAGAEGEERQLTVTWDSQNQGQIVANHFSFFEEGRTAPSTFQILYAMEDYWVLKAIMQIIARTNEGVPAYRRDLAAIRDIQSIEIGRSGGDAGGQIYRPPTTEEDGEGLVGPGATPDRSTVQPGPESGIEFGEGSAQVKELADNRYRDKENKPLPAEKLKSAATGKDDADAYLAVAKRMPVRMRVKMDQRKLNKFLVECGNGDLMLEVVQVRINPENDVQQMAGTGGTGSPRPGVNRNIRGGSSGTETGLGEKEEPWDVNVEVYGIIYIFNPPSIERLEISKEDQAKLDAVDLDDTNAVQAAAAVPAEGEPAKDPDADPPGETEPPVEPADDTPAVNPAEEAARTEPAKAEPAG